MKLNEYQLRLGLRQKAYCGLLLDEKAKIFLEDLARFCRADSSTFHEDPRIHAVLEGRREVWLRIQDHLKLNPEEFMERYAQVKSPRKITEHKDE